MTTKSVLCVMDNSNYYQVKGLDLWDKKRNAYNYKGTGKIIAHPPCQQWSRLRSFAKEDKEEKELAVFCIEIVKKQGGILEHPMGSALFKHVGISTDHLIEIDQCWWGFPARKRTWLYCVDTILLPTPKLWFPPTKSVEQMNAKLRSKQPKKLCEWLVESTWRK